MAKTVDLDALIPEDLEFNYRGKTYTIPGDVDTETVLRMFRLFQLMLETTEKARKPGTDRKRTGAQIDRAYEEIKSILLSLFHINHPEMTELPFGHAAMPHVIAGILDLLGVTTDPRKGETISEPSTTSPPKKPRSSAPRKRSSTAKAASRRSSGSPSS